MQQPIPFTEKGLRVTTDQIKSVCKTIIKICDTQPHAVDSLAEEVYTNLHLLYYTMKQSADRAEAERIQFELALSTRRNARQAIPALAKRYPVGMTAHMMRERQKRLEDAAVQDNELLAKLEAELERRRGR